MNKISIMFSTDKYFQVLAKDIIFTTIFIAVNMHKYSFKKYK